MKRLTKAQKGIEKLAKNLSKPSEAFRKWDLRLRAKQNFKDSDEVYESYFSVCGKYSVERVFQVGKDYCDEVAQAWVDTDNGRTFYRERHSQMIYGGNYGYRFQGYDASTPFIFKRKSGMSDQYGYLFLRPFQRGGQKLTAILARKGVTTDDLNEFGTRRLAETLADPRMETILKHSYKDFYWMLKKHRHLSDAVWSAYKITIRRNYRIRNMELWYDMVENMAYLGMDTHNHRYVCPFAYKRMHDDIVERANRKRDKERRLMEIDTARAKNELHKDLIEERISKFGDLCISNGTLHSVVMITYDDYVSEGSAMHHCVGGYFDKKTSLILSFRDNEGKRVETVEVSLRSFSIIQSRGVCNKSTKYHNEIIDLVNANMAQIQKRMVA